MKKSKIIIIEVLVLLLFLGSGTYVFYLSLIYPPFPEPVKYIKPGMTKLDMPEAESIHEELIPDFLSGAVYRRADLEAVAKERAKVTRLALLIPSIGYTTYAFFRFGILNLIFWMIRRFGRRGACPERK